MLNKYESLAAAIWRDPLPDYIKAGALIIVVERRGVYRRFFTANAAAAWGRIERHSHIIRFWRFHIAEADNLLFIGHVNMAQIALKPSAAECKHEMIRNTGHKDRARILPCNMVAIATIMACFNKWPDTKQAFDALVVIC